VDKLSQTNIINKYKFLRTKAIYLSHVISENILKIRNDLDSKRILHIIKHEKYQRIVKEIISDSIS